MAPFTNEPIKLKRIFLTVGTTSFDSLIRVVDTQEFLDVIIKCGCDTLVLQIGRGVNQPTFLTSKMLLEQYKISFECFRFKPSLSKEMESADLIISHGGAGSILEAITLHKLLIVVVNDTLQENHQVELANAMTSRNHCFQALPNSLLDPMNDIVQRLSKIQIHSDKNKNKDTDTDSSSSALNLDLVSDGGKQLKLLQSLHLEPYPEANLNAFPSVVDSMFNWCDNKD
jgi:beta-1,4-N-acetylglucosaminyltransferase